MPVGTKRGLLAKYARPQDERKTHSLTTKITEQEYDEFTEYAASLGLTPSEAIRFLILEELARMREAEQEIPSRRRMTDRKGWHRS
jgi:antitoxin component of RelBE/YafQ-DinJ toxin-antitoxin module